MGRTTTSGQSAKAWVASADEAGAVAELLDAFNTEFDAETPGRVVLARRLRVLLATRQTFAVLAGTPARSVGVVTLRPNVWIHGAVALLDELYTAPERRGLGLGSAVLTAAIDEARRRGATEFEIEVDEPDTDAHRFYGRHGFPVRDPATGDRAFVLRKVIASHRRTAC
jgi:GNAT superfamily N-acetyltransferase